ncbi:hypothetical protein C8R46DRAFT_243372 [Mycena filopes]|nr:hypothetical protein C8R46DRAFT_243372 [Mycena filopes]
MDPELPLDDEYPSPSAPDEQEFTSHGGGMFAGSQNFVIAGGTFTNLTTPAAPTDLRMIPLGDIDLQQQLSVESGSGIIGRIRERHCVRRVYSARLGGRAWGSKVTVATYQGDRAEEEWREHIERYMAVRDPNIVQVYGGASHGNIYATVFYGDLVPFKQYMASYSPIMTVYMYACSSYQWRRTSIYLFDTLLRGAGHQMWIRRSTGRLCVDLVAASPEEPRLIPWMFAKESIAFALTSSPIINEDAEAIESLTIEDYHMICSWSLCLDRRSLLPPSEIVSLGAVLDGDHINAEIASLVDVDIGGEMTRTQWRPTLGGKVMEAGWTRYQATDVFNVELSAQLKLLHGLASSEGRAWLSQAHHIFTRRQITSHLDAYVLVDSVGFILSISGPSTTPPPGYLFVCPIEAFKIGPSTFKWPDCPAYWSLDPSGIDRLSTEEATQLRFPSMELRTTIKGRSWDSSVYAGLGQFHEAKGFDPDSQDLARHLGHPLYRVSGAMDLPFAHGGSFRGGGRCEPRRVGR